MSSGTEQNKSEEATPFKLEQARRKGSVARGMDLGFFSSMGAFLLFLAVAGAGTAAALINFTRASISDFGPAQDPTLLLSQVGAGWSLLLQIVFEVGAAILLIVIPIEIVQLRGLTFSAHPLKPDFKRLNPAQGLKRLLSMRTLKEALKSIVKFAIYCGVTYVALHSAWQRLRVDLNGGREFAMLLWSESLKLVALFVLAALFLAAIDQIMARKEFAKQMRMSRSEVTREHKEREGEPRLKAKRKDLHAQIQKQAEGLGKLAGSDVLIVNPEHYAIALHYDGQSMAAPRVRAMGRNLIALEMKRRAASLSIPIVRDPPLARALFKSSAIDREIAPDFYRDVAGIYTRLRTRTDQTDS